jgi:hypothetical protein
VNILEKAIVGSTLFVLKSGTSLRVPTRLAPPPYGSHTPQTVTRTIEPKHYIRPIPQGQLDGMDMTPEEKITYQNPGLPVNEQLPF